MEPHVFSPSEPEPLEKKNAEPENVLAWNMILPMHIAHGQELSCDITVGAASQ